MNVSELINKYISYRRSIGEKFSTNSKILYHFLRHLKEDDISLLTESICSDFLIYPTGIITNTWHVKYIALNGFFFFFFTRGYMDYIPLPKEKPQYQKTFKPYIYSDEEIKRLFDCSLTLYKRKTPIFPECIKCIIQLTYFMGLRIGETMRLAVGDCDLESRCMLIRETKFYKSRIVTYNNQVKDVIIAFLDWRKTMSMPTTSETPLFLMRNMQPMKQQVFSQIFRRVRDNAEIHREDRGKYQPRVHDLRHTFAVRRLTEWYQRGQDVQVMLPRLSTYLGHTNISGTSVYLTMTPELLASANDRFCKYANMEENDYE